MSSFNFKAVIFDLDGVITQTALVHSKAWKEMFDEYLKSREEKNGESFKEFNHKTDYLTYIDGKPRYKGVESFLQSRGIDIPYGKPSDPPGEETVCGLGNRKNELFNKVLVRDGVKVYDTTVDLIKQLRANNIKVGVASSSKNCSAVLEAAGLSDLFEVSVDGITSAELHLKGKPEPDIFTTACRKLKVHPDMAVVVEDAVSGVQAGVKGNFGLILGIARENNKQDLKSNGADIVVEDLGEINLDTIEKWFTNGLEKDSWHLNFYDYSKDKESVRESLCAVGNGYFATRGALEQCKANGLNYPGTYIAGVYNRLKSHIAGKKIVNEDIVNSPNWLYITFKTKKDEWFGINQYRIVRFSRSLNFKNGLSSIETLIRDNKGRETLIESRKTASMDEPHIALLKYCLTPMNYSGDILIRSGIDGGVTNAGVKRYRELNSRHLKTIACGGKNNISYLLATTNQSKIEIAEAAKIGVYINGGKCNPDIGISVIDNAVYSDFTLSAKQGDTICVEKLTAIYTSKDNGIGNPLEKAKKAAANLTSFNEMAENSEKSWSNIWSKIDIKIEGNRLVQKLVRLNLYHLMITASIHNNHIDAGLPARGLFGEAYHGHIFWDELFILPFYTLHFQNTAKSLLLYRYRRLNSARKYARENGYKGAMFPWQSGSDGREETQVIHLNPLSGKWGNDYSRLQRHVSLAIAYNIWHYYYNTFDLSFIENYGAEMFLEICRFLASISSFNKKTGRYEIKNVMGPDEYHEKSTVLKDAGLKDNSYTNIMAVWAFNRAFDILNLLSGSVKEKLITKLELTEDELKKWQDISRKMNLVISDEGLIAQFDGYSDLEELDWEKYKERNRSNRIDRILKAEGKSPDNYKVSKQADTLMIFYLLSLNEVRNILTKLGYTYRDDILRVNFDYYLKRTSHDSSLSKIVHSYLAKLIGYNKLSYELYIDSLETDYKDTQGGTTGEGIHTGVMAGSVMHIIHAFMGLNTETGTVSINPSLPEDFRKVSANINFRGVTYYFEITHQSIRLKIKSSISKNIRVLIRNKEIGIMVGEWKEYRWGI